MVLCRHLLRHLQLRRSSELIQQLTVHRLHVITLAGVTAQTGFRVDTDALVVVCKFL